MWHLHAIKCISFFYGFQILFFCSLSLSLFLDPSLTTKLFWMKNFLASFIGVFSLSIKLVYLGMEIILLVPLAICIHWIFWHIVSFFVHRYVFCSSFKYTLFYFSLCLRIFHMICCHLRDDSFNCVYKTDF